MTTGGSHLLALQMDKRWLLEGWENQGKRPSLEPQKRGPADTSILALRAPRLAPDPRTH